jgi:hypothetical protein
MEWPIPVELRSEGFSWFALDGGAAIAEWSQRQGDGPFWLQTQLAWIDREGAITRKQAFELFQFRWESPGWSRAALALGPSFLVLFLMPAYWDRASTTAAVSFMLAENWASLLFVCAVSAALSWLAYRRQARFALPGAGVWAAFVFLFGLPGWLAYRWHRRWPVLEACGECRRPAPRDRESCASCGEVFAPPPLVGTEVFA